MQLPSLKYIQTVCLPTFESIRKQGFHNDLKNKNNIMQIFNLRVNSGKLE